jgi:hypothetical protein
MMRTGIRLFLIFTCHITPVDLRGGRRIEVVELAAATNLAWKVVAAGDYNGDGTVNIL